MNKLKKFWFIMCALVFVFVTAMPVYAKTQFAYMYFFSTDGNEIEDLSKRVKIKNGEAKGSYTFSDPNTFEYIFQDIDRDFREEDADLNGFTVDEIENTHGIAWVEIDEDGIRIDHMQYKNGETIEVTPGDHYYRVLTDNPLVTGENINMSSADYYVDLYFLDDAGEYIDDLETEIMGKKSGGYSADTFTFPDPNQHAIDGTGIYWYYMDDEDGEEYLFKGGQQATFKPGEYEFKVITDKPVNVYFHYPDNLDITDPRIENEKYDEDNPESGERFREAAPGDIYYHAEAKVGDQVRMMKSLGAIVWGCSFVGWDIDGETLGPGKLYRISEPNDLHFYAVYEEDDNWDPFETDQNGLDKNKDNLIRQAKEVNSIAGDGYGAAISNGKLTRASGQQKVNGRNIPNSNKSLVLYGIPGGIPWDVSRSALVDPNADPMVVDNYTKTADGVPIEELDLEEDLELNEVLMQHDAAYYMDIFGNSFVYHEDLTRIQDMCLAYARYNEAITPGFAQLVQHFDAEAINRQRAIEFALLSGQYPGEENSYYKQFNSNNATVVATKQLIGLNGDEKLPEWKNSYLSKETFNELLWTKQIWNTGWLSSYDDGLYEKLQKQNNGKIKTSDASIKRNSLRSLFVTEVYASEDGEEYNNQDAVGAQFGGLLINSMDVSGKTFPKQYFEPGKMYTFTNFAFVGLSELNAEQISVLKRIFEALTARGYTTQMAAAACGNIWQECGFNPKATGGGYGIIQWASEGRINKLKEKAIEKGSTWEDLDVQIAYMIDELEAGQENKMNNYIGKQLEGQTIRTIDDIDIACEAWCKWVEGCTCQNPETGEIWHSAHNDQCEENAEGDSYQHLKTRKSYSKRVYDALTYVGSIGSYGSFSGKGNSEILSAILGYGSMGEFARAVRSGAVNWNRDVDAKQHRFTLHNGMTVTAHEAIAQDLETALNTIIDMGFPIKQVSCYGGIDRVNVNSTDSMSFHAPGLAVDINWDWNPNQKGSVSWLQKPQNEWVRLIKGMPYRPLEDPRSITTREAYILLSYGLGWGRDFSGTFDFMHFSMGEVSQHHRNRIVSETMEGEYARHNYSDYEANKLKQQQDTEKKQETEVIVSSDTESNPSAAVENNN